MVDHPLAQRLEQVEGAIATSYIEAARVRKPERNADWRQFDGTYAIFDGVDSPMGQTFGLGMAGPPDLPALETYFSERGTATMHEVCPFAGVETLGLLVDRGYRPVELSNVLVQPIAPQQPPDSALRARIIEPRDHDTWVATAISGWSEDPAIAAIIRDLSEIAVANARVLHYVVEDGEAPIATASFGVHGDIALLAGASTVPAARGRGAQSLLLATRLAEARRRGCTLAMMITAVGTTSQRNAERNGFRVAYTRTKWRRDCRSA